MASSWSGYVSVGGDLATAALALAKNNPAVASTVALGTGGLAVVAAPGLAITPIIGALQYFGFGVGGIAGGTVAASTQATIGNVVAPSLFATLTSAGAGGYGVATISTGAQWICGTIMGLAGASGAWLSTRT